MALWRTRRSWEHLAKQDAMHAVLTYKDDWDEAEFFETGSSEIEGLMARLSELGLEPHRSRAIDFGCGLGRLTRGLAGFFDEVVGVDISASMIEQATELNREFSGCQFITNTSTDLSQIPSDSASLVYSNITLQHMPPKAALAYIREFVRVAASGGVVVFQMPALSKHSDAGPLSGARRALRSARRVIDRDMDMNVLPKADVVEQLESAGAQVIAVDPDDRAGSDWVGYRYFARA